MSHAPGTTIAPVRRGGLSALWNRLPVEHQVKQSMGLQRGMHDTGLVITGLFVLTAIFAPLISPYGFSQLRDANGPFGAQVPRAAPTSSEPPSAATTCCPACSGAPRPPCS